MNETLWLAGRLCLGALFVAGAVQHAFAFTAVSQQIAARGVPGSRVVLAVGSIWQAAAGGLLILGIQAAYAAASLVLFTLFASLMLLDFWNRQGPERTGMLASWRLNIAIIGGLLVAVAYARMQG